MCLSTSTRAGFVPRLNLKPGNESLQTERVLVTTSTLLARNHEVSACLAKNSLVGLQTRAVTKGEYW